MPGGSSPHKRLPEPRSLNLCQKEALFGLSLILEVKNLITNRQRLLGFLFAYYLLMVFSLKSKLSFQAKKKICVFIKKTINNENVDVMMIFFNKTKSR